MADNAETVGPQILLLILAIVDAIIENLPELVDAGMSIIGGLLDGMVQKSSELISAIGDIIEDLIESVCEILGIASPSTVFSDIGDNIIAGLLEGLKNAWTTVESWFTTAWDNIKSMFELPDWAKSLFGIKDKEKTETETGESLPAGTATAEVTNMMVIDTMTPVPQTVIDSYTALSAALLAVNTEVAKLNGFFGGAVAAEGAAAEGAAASGEVVHYLQE
jgi:hypothetical protein